MQCLARLLLLCFATISYATEDKCNRDRNDEECHRQEDSDSDCVLLGPPVNSPSIAIRDSSGRLGNHMFAYMMLLSLREQAGYRTFITKKTHSYLNPYFEHIDVDVAEERLCGYEDMYEAYTEQKGRSIVERIEKELGGQKVSLETDEHGRVSVPADLIASTGLQVDRIVHSKEFNLAAVGVTPPHSAIPWEVFSASPLSDLAKAEYRVGRALILYPEGMGAFGTAEANFVKQAPNIEEKLQRAFTLKEDIVKAANATVASILLKHKSRRNGGKKKKKSAVPVLVGIHARMTDHQSLELENGQVPVKASYFIKAMDMFRDRYKNVVFVYVSDDMAWAKRNLAPRNKLGDLYLAGAGRPADVDSVGHDMAVMSLCQHAILTYGTFSYWLGFLAGGSVVLPTHFPEYVKDRSQLLPNPIDNPLPRLRPYW